MSLLQEMMQNGESPQDRQAPPNDVESAVNAAIESDDMTNMGFGTELASDEEHRVLSDIMDSIEMTLHGNASNKVENLLKNSETPFEGVAAASQLLIIQSYKQANKQGIEVSPDLYFAENGVIQTTTELVWEFADAMGLVGEGDDGQFEASLFDTFRRIGETVMDQQNPELAKSAEEMMIEMETGEPFDSDEIPEEGMQVPPYRMEQGVGVMPAQEGPQGAPLPPQYR